MMKWQNDRRRRKYQSALANFESLEDRRLLVAGIALGFSAELTSAFERVSDLDNYSNEQLEDASRWVLQTDGLTRQEVADQLQIAPTDVIRVVSIANTYAVDVSSLSTEDTTTTEILTSLPNVNFVYPLINTPRELRLVPNDPFFNQQFNLRNSQLDPGFTTAWDKYTGEGVVIGIVDEGVQSTHPDLRDNYLASASYDFASNDPNANPISQFAHHGTSVAGVAAASGNNGIGISGAAPDASIASIRLPLLVNQSDLIESHGVGFSNQTIDIYNHSWGPSDDGQIDGPGPLFIAAMEKSIAEGRNGLGNIHVWAAGNGNESNDDVNLDGYANMRYTIAVGAVGDDGQHAFYSEPGASLFISAISSDRDQNLISTDLVGRSGRNISVEEEDGDSATDVDYTGLFGGTSAAAPVVAGVAALMLEANPHLSWRDVQHILAETATKNDPSDSQWMTNAGGFDFNPKYGFGTVNAAAAVELASSWKTIGDEQRATAFMESQAVIDDNSSQGVVSTLQVADSFDVDWAQVSLTADHNRRGDLEVVLTSPSGTSSVLASPRDDEGDYFQWTFTSTQFWGEDSKGDWSLTLRDLQTGEIGTLLSWELSVFGSESENDDNGSGNGDNGNGDGGDGPTDPVVDPPVVDPPAVDPPIVDPPGGGDSVVPPNGGDSGGGIDTPTPKQTGSISGTVLQNIDSNVFRNQLGVSGITVYLDTNGDGRVGIHEPRTETDIRGRYSFQDIPEGQYEVRMAETAGWLATSNNDSRSVLVRNTNEEATFTVRANRDFGDAPFPYPTSLASNGAVHAIDNRLFLGSRVDSDADGIGNTASDIDDINVNDDEDGVEFTSAIRAGTTADLSVTSSNTGFLQAWIDFNADGDWDDSGEQILSNSRVTAGVNEFSYLVPRSVLNGITYARFRLSSQIDISYSGPAIGGEVEDYVVLIGEDSAEVRSPVARADSLTVLENSENNLLDVMANDVLPLSGARIASIEAETLRGGLIIGAGGGSLEYTPPVNYHGIDEFSYTIENLVGQTSQASVSIIVQDIVEPPIANDDQFRIITNSETTLLSVLANDSSNSGTLLITSVSDDDSTGEVTISEDRKSLFYTPAADFSGTDTLSYTITDPTGLTVDANVSIDVATVHQTVKIELMTVDASSGEEITNVRPGSDFELRAYVTDLRNQPMGVFSAYLDVVYDSTLAMVTGGIAHSDAYPNVISGSTETPGLIDEVGGTDGVRPLGGDTHLLFSVPMRAIGQGDLRFFADPSDVLPDHQVLHFGGNATVDNGQIEYVDTTLVSANFTNEANELDANGDGTVSPIDALLLINELNQLGPRTLSPNLDLPMIPSHFVDINKDGSFSAFDALLIINHLNALKRAVPVNAVADDAVVDFVDVSMRTETQDDDDSDVIQVDELTLEKPAARVVDRLLEVQAVESIFDTSE